MILLLFSPSVVSDSWNPMHCSPPGYFVHGISQSRILKWVTVSFPRGSFPCRDRTCVSVSPALASGFFTTVPPGKAQYVLDMCYYTCNQFSSVAQSRLTLCHPMDCSTPGLPVHHQLPELAQTHVHPVGDAKQPSHPLWSPSPPAFNLSQHQDLFQWVSSLYQVAKVLEFQLQHQSFQWIFRTDFPYDWLVGSPCSPRDSQESSLTPQFKTINYLVLSFLYSPALIHRWLLEKP